MRIDYRTERYEAEVPVEAFTEDCVDVEKFVAFCRECHNHDRLWSCPEFSFDANEYWKKYSRLKLFGIKILMPEEVTAKEWTKEERGEIIEQTLWIEKQKLTEELFAMEKEYPGSISLSAGSCQVCGKDHCARIEGKPCRHPEQLRYSIEALGGDVGLTVTKYLGLELKWIEGDRIPPWFILVGGLLLP
ncbi:MAG: DUF2284 domain-containing protein [Blautia sp.]|nr:DUF2284 domain-containing protein [Blautia sp.]